MRIDLRAHRIVHASPAELFDVLADLDQHWQLTDGAVERVGRSDGGAVVRISGPFGLRRTATTRIDTATPRELTGTARVGADTVARVAWHLEPAAAGTAVTLSVVVLRASAQDRLVLALGAGARLRGRLARALERLDELALEGALAAERVA